MTPVPELTAAAVFKIFESRGLTPEEDEYIKYHAERIASTIRLVASLIDREGQHVLDVGPHFLTVVMSEFLKRHSARIHTLGWANERLVPIGLAASHCEHDLNQPLPLLREAPFDGIVMAETIEHLYAAPTLVVSGMARTLAPGGWLVLQTPNAASITKRLKLLLGHNPYEMIREDMFNPGHYREYTAAELVQIGESAGLRTEHVEHSNYWQSTGWRGVVEKYARNLRNGLTVVFRKR